jgi:drug/metabolite transporter (DMT)-like permease
MTLLLVANALWGSSYVVVKVALEEIPFPVLAAARYVVATLALWGLHLITRQGRTFPVRQDAIKLLALGIIGVAAHGLLGYWGVSLTTATDASLMIVGEVIFTTLLAVAIAGDYVGRPRVVGMAAGVVGVVVLVLGSAGQPLESAPNRPLGDILILTALAFEAVFTVLGTTLTRRYDPLVVLTLSLTGSCVVWLPLIGWYALQGRLVMPSPLALAGVLYLALVASVLCYLIWFAVLRIAGPTLGALSLLAQPLVGAVLGISLLADPVLPSTLIGGACVLLCLALAPQRGRTSSA